MTAWAFSSCPGGPPWKNMPASRSPVLSCLGAGWNGALVANVASASDRPPSELYAMTAAEALKVMALLSTGCAPASSCIHVRDQDPLGPGHDRLLDRASSSMGSDAVD